MKKTLKTVSIFLLVVVLLGTTSVLLYLHSRPSPLEPYDFTNCTVGVYGYWSDETICDLTQAETEEAVQVLKTAKIFPIAEKSDFQMTGQTRLFRIRLSDGNTLELGAGGTSYIYLNGKWYRCDKPTANYFSNLFMDYAHRYFVPISEQK